MSDRLEYKINKEAVFSDETPFFRFPTQPTWKDRVRLRLRVLENDVDRVEALSDNEAFGMEKEKSENGFDYYKLTLLPSEKNISYSFVLYKGDEKLFYSKVGISHNHMKYADFVILKDFKTPLWSNGRIIYQIYVDRFFNGDKTNDVKTNEYVYLKKKVKQVEDWYKYPESEDIWNFYGGDLEGVIKKLEYLKALGVEAIYFNPIFVSPSNHKYDIQDYEHIDPHFGKIVVDKDVVLNENDKDNTNAEMYAIRTTDFKNLTSSDEVFIELVRIAHGMGIKVILDGVFNHCGAFNKWIDREKIYGRTGKYEKGAFDFADSPYRDYFLWKDDGTYECWWDYENHPKLNYEGSGELFLKIMSIAKKWLMPPFDADGWRIDVAADLGLSPEYNHYFWREFRKAVKSAKPEAIILAEHYGDSSPWLKGDQWDTIMNYDAFMEPVSYFLTGMEKHSDSFNERLFNNGWEFANTMVQKMSKLPVQALFSSMNELSNHDHSRFLTRTNHICGRTQSLGPEAAQKNVDMAVMREAVLIQMTWVGAPTIYYGDEAGLCGFTDPDNRRTYPWGYEDVGLIEYHRELIKIRKKNTVLNFGSTMFLVEGYGIIVYARFDEERKIVVAINNSNEECSVNIPMWRTGIEGNEKITMIYKTCHQSFGYSGKEFEMKAGFLEISLKERSGVILSNGD